MGADTNTKMKSRRLATGKWPLFNLIDLDDRVLVAHFADHSLIGLHKASNYSYQSAFGIDRRIEEALAASHVPPLGIVIIPRPILVSEIELQYNQFGGCLHGASLDHFPAPHHRLLKKCIRLLLQLGKGTKIGHFRPGLIGYTGSAGR